MVYAFVREEAGFPVVELKFLGLLHEENMK